MSAKMVQIGARIPHRDAEFIANLKIEGAATPSDKVRAIIAEARRRQQGTRDYPASLAAMQELLAPTLTEVRRCELRLGRHSELVVRVLDGLPELLAFAVSSHGGLAAGSAGEAELQAFEQGLADRFFRLAEALLQLGVTRRTPCYQPEVLMEHLEPILDLARAIERARSPHQ